MRAIKAIETESISTCEDKLKTQKEEIESEHDAYVKELTGSCKEQCDQKMHKVNTSAEIECKKGKDQL